METGASRVKGIKGPSILYLIPKFYIVGGMIPESMYWLWLGLTQMLFTELTEAKGMCWSKATAAYLYPVAESERDSRSDGAAIRRVIVA